MSDFCSINKQVKCLNEKDRESIVKVVVMVYGFWPLWGCFDWICQHENVCIGLLFWEDLVAFRKAKL